MPKAEISDKEITATPASEILRRTRALPNDTNVSPPRCYAQCVEGPEDKDEEAGETLEEENDEESLNGLQGPAYDSE